MRSYSSTSAKIIGKGGIFLVLFMYFAGLDVPTYMFAKSNSLLSLILIKKYRNY